MPAPVSRRLFLQRVGAAAGALLVGWPFDSAGAGRKTIELICRDAWGARDPTGRFHRHRVRRLTVHHTAVVFTDNREAPERMRAHQRYHQSLGWPDIAYHIVIDRHGNLFQGRPRWAVGDTSTNYDPRGHLLVTCEGNFQTQRPTDRQVRALVDVLAWAVEYYGVSPRKIRGHGAYAQTSCPGTALRRLLSGGALRRRVRNRIRDGGVRMEPLCGRAGRRRVEAIEAGRA